MHTESNVKDKESQFQMGLAYAQGKGVVKSYQLASNYYKLAADQGHLKAQVALARLYEEGDGVEQSFEQAFHYYRLAADQKIICVDREAGALIRKFIEQSPERAFECLQQAANQKSPFAYYSLAECFINGIGTTKSIENALNYYRLASHEGYACCLSSIARYLSDEGINKKAIARLLKSIISKNVGIRADQLYTLAQLFEQGNDLLYSPNAAIHFYTLAAELGNMLAKRRLGDVYLQGLLGVEKNEELAVHYYIAGKSFAKIIHLAEKYIQSSPKLSFEYFQRVFQVDKKIGASKLGYCYKHGIGVEASLEKAIEYYKIACENGSSINYYRLGDCFERIGDAESLKQAFHYYLTGSQKDSYECYFRLGQLYEAGKGIPQSFEKAFECYVIAAKKGYSPAWFYVGLCFLNGKGTEKSEIEAFKAFQFCNTDKGLYQLAVCYLQGIGTAPSIKDAKLNFYQSARRGLLDAHIQLLNLLEEECRIKQPLGQPTDPEEWKKEKNRYLLGKRFERLAEEFSTLHDTKWELNCLNEADAFGAIDKPFYLFRLGEYYHNLKRDDSANKYFEKAARQGYVQAQYALGKYYHKDPKSSEKAINYFTLAAEQGHLDSQLILGNAYLNGQGVTQSAGQAFNYFKLAADQLDADAQYQVGLCFQQGIGVAQSEDQAIRYFQLSAIRGNLKAWEMFAKYFRYGIDKDQSYDVTLKKMRYLANKASPMFQHQLGFDFEKGQNGLQQSYQEAFQLYLLAANQNYVPSYYRLGIYYQKGLAGLEQSDQKACEYFTLAANGNHLNSQCIIGDAYRKGRGVEQSDERSFYYYRRAADQGSMKAQFIVANDFHNGVGSSFQSSRRALQYYEMAAHQGHPLSVYIVGMYFKNGLDNAEQSEVKAFQYFKRSTDLGCKEAKYALAQCYEKGIGVESSVQLALHYYLLAAEQGEARAQLKLGEWYQWGKRNLIGKSPIKACEYYTKAADRGNMQAQYRLAELYRTGGKDFQENWKKALVYYKLAAEHGHPKSIRVLYDCYHYGKRVAQSYVKALNYLILGTQLKDPDCQFHLGKYYDQGLGNLIPSLKEALKYYHLAAAQRQRDAKQTLEWIHRILSPYAQQVDIEPYLKNQSLSTLEKILKSYGNNPIFLERSPISWEEAQVFRDAMIENPRLTILCSVEQELSPLFLAFELIGYEQSALRHDKVINHTNQQEVIGCVFVGNDLRDSTLKEK